MACAILEISALRQQEVPGTLRDIDHKWIAGSSGSDTLIDHLELDIKDSPQFFVAKRFEDHDLVQTVDELRREFPPGGCDAGTRHLGAECLTTSCVVRRGRVEA